MKRKLLISFLSLSLSVMPAIAVYANCVGGSEGKIVQIKVQSCKEIIADNNADVQKYAGEFYKIGNKNEKLKKFYTGALIKTESGVLMMYPSNLQSPCTEFSQKATVSKKLYSICCDTGKWGKCVFGGNFLADIEAKPINAFQ